MKRNNKKKNAKNFMKVTKIRKTSRKQKAFMNSKRIFTFFVVAGEVSIRAANGLSTTMMRTLCPAYATALIMERSKTKVKKLNSEVVTAVIKVSTQLKLTGVL